MNCIISEKPFNPLLPYIPYNQNVHTFYKIPSKDGGFLNLD